MVSSIFFFSSGSVKIMSFKFFPHLETQKFDMVEKPSLFIKKHKVCRRYIRLSRGIVIFTIEAVIIKILSRNIISHIINVLNRAFGIFRSFVNLGPNQITEIKNRITHPFIETLIIFEILGEQQVWNAVIICALNVDENNTFSSFDGVNNLYNYMSPAFSISQHCCQGSGKAKYSIEFGISL